MSAGEGGESAGRGGFYLDRGPEAEKKKAFCSKMGQIVGSGLAVNSTSEKPYGTPFGHGFFSTEMCCLCRQHWVEIDGKLVKLGYGQNAEITHLEGSPQSGFAGGGFIGCTGRWSIVSLHADGAGGYTSISPSPNPSRRNIGAECNAGIAGAKGNRWA